MLPLEKISTQNGPPKENNNIIVKIIKWYLLILEEEKKKTTFLFVFLTYLPVFLLKFRFRELVGCRIKFCIQWVPTWHTFYGPFYPKNKKCLKKWNDDIIIPFFSGISCFWGSGVRQNYVEWVLVWVAGSVNELSRSKFE